MTFVDECPGTNLIYYGRELQSNSTPYAHISTITLSLRLSPLDSVLDTARTRHNSSLSLLTFRCTVLSIFLTLLDKSRVGFSSFELLSRKLLHCSRFLAACCPHSASTIDQLLLYFSITRGRDLSTHQPK